MRLSQSTVFLGERESRRRSKPDPNSQTKSAAAPKLVYELPPLRFEVAEAARLLRMSRAQLYNRMKEGLIMAQKDGVRTYITRAELERYVAACGSGLRAS